MRYKRLQGHQPDTAPQQFNYILAPVMLYDLAILGLVFEMMNKCAGFGLARVLIDNNVNIEVVGHRAGASRVERVWESGCSSAAPSQPPPLFFSPPPSSPENSRQFSFSSFAPPPAPRSYGCRQTYDHRSWRHCHQAFFCTSRCGNTVGERKGIPRHASHLMLRLQMKKR